AFVIRSANVNVNPMATFFSLAALFYAEGVREGDRPGRCAALAGAMAGLATVSKYPSVLVCLAVALAIVLARRSWGEKLRLLVTSGVATAVSAAVAMPALVLNPAAVVKQVRFQSTVYQRHAVGSYWDQAVVRAEWDLPLEHPELGLTFLILTAAGLAVALGDRRWRKPVLGWLLFALATFALFAQYRFRAFRNLLPLVPLGCVLVALLYARVREALPPRPRWALDLVAAALPALLFTPAILQFSRFQLAVDDSREQAVRWLTRHTGPAHRVLFTEELEFLPHRIESLRAQTAVRPWQTARSRILRQRFHYVVVPGFLDPEGRPLIAPPLAERILQRYEIATRFGSKSPFQIQGGFKGNEQLICILEKKSPAANR
ncbi:MAG TPA: glycosyltransferase family 39 protein, partial [Thermoanaerobaculia bacterium]|nr:glycosyltransferase family 39 protein [Thermoanaerobaculia bacterium]